MAKKVLLDDLLTHVIALRIAYNAGMTRRRWLACAVGRVKTGIQFSIQLP